MAAAEVDAVVHEVAHALQVAMLLATQVRQSAGVQTEDSIRLEAAVSRAAKALKRLTPDGVVAAADDAEGMRGMRHMAHTIGLTDLLMTASKSKQGSQIKELLRKALLLLGASDEEVPRGRHDSTRK